MRSPRRPVSSRCDPDVWDTARAASQGMLAHDPTYSLSQLLEDALQAEISRLQDTFNAGRPWPDVTKARPGRRTGADTPNLTRNGRSPQ